MGTKSEAWKQWKALRDEQTASKRRQAEIERELEELVKAIASSAPEDDEDRAAQQEFESFEAGGAPKKVVEVVAKTGDVLKDIDTALAGSKNPQKAGSSSGGSSGL